MRKGEGYRWHSDGKKELVEHLAGEGTAEERGEETSKEEVNEKAKEEVNEIVKGELHVEAQRQSTIIKDKLISEATTPRISLLDALIGEELLTSPAKSSRPVTPTSSASKALITMVVEPSHTQLDQSAFPSGLQGHLVPFERVPMVEFVKALE